jgi:hypothetical protein
MFFLCLGKCLYLSGLIPRPMNADNDRELLGDKFLHLYFVWLYRLFSTCIFYSPVRTVPYVPIVAGLRIRIDSHGFALFLEAVFPDPHQSEKMDPDPH